MKTKYKKLSLPLNKVTGRHFLSRPLDCQAVGMSLVRYKPGEGGAFVHRHKVQEEIYMTLKGTGSIILDGLRHARPEGTIGRVSPRVNRAIGNDSRRDVIFAILGAIPPKKFPQGGRTLLGDGIPVRKKTVQWKRSKRRSG